MQNAKAIGETCRQQARTLIELLVVQAHKMLQNQYFTKVGRIPDFGCAWRAYARHAHPKSGFSEMFRELLRMAKAQSLYLIFYGSTVSGVKIRPN